MLYSFAVHFNLINNKTATMKAKIKLLSIVLISAMALQLQSCCNPKPSFTLDVPLDPQKTSMWCWAASGEMCMDFLGGNVEQCDEANKEFSRTDCCNNPTPGDCINGGWPETISSDTILKLKVGANSSLQNRLVRCGVPLFINSTRALSL
jgi:hypothetical protein